MARGASYGAPLLPIGTPTYFFDLSRPLLKPINRQHWFILCAFVEIGRKPVGVVLTHVSERRTDEPFSLALFSGALVIDY